MNPKKATNADSSLRSSKAVLHPSTAQDPASLNFGVQNRSGALDPVWPSEEIYLSDDPKISPHTSTGAAARSIPTSFSSGVHHFLLRAAFNAGVVTNTPQELETVGERIVRVS